MFSLFCDFIAYFLRFEVNQIRTYSEQFEKYYNDEDTVLIKDPKQQRLYIKHGAKLADLFYSDDRVIYVFFKNGTRELYRKWLAHELF